MSGGHERWLVSYADFMTLLFAVFVMLWSTSTVDANKYRGISDALSEMSADNDKKMYRKEDTTQAQMQIIAEDLMRMLKEMDNEEMISVSFDAKKVRVLLSADLAFESAKADILEEARPVLKLIFDKLQKSKFSENPEMFMDIVGHTDSLPIHSTLFPSNWELSAARAASVARFATTDFPVAHKIRVIGYADTAPISMNDTADGRAKNRRVELVLLTHPEFKKTVSLSPDKADKVDKKIKTDKKDTTQVATTPLDVDVSAE